MSIRLATFGSTTALLICLGSGWAADEQSGNRQLTDAEKSFLTAAAVGNNSEIELSKVAADKARAAGVRSFAQQMIDDHSKNYRELLALCQKKNYLIAPELDSGHREILRKLESAESGDAFDGAYIDAMVADHSEMDGILERIANNSNDSDITRFASDTLATVKKHEQMAKDLSGK